MIAHKRGLPKVKCLPAMTLHYNNTRHGVGWAIVTGISPPISMSFFVTSINEKLETAQR
jgi:peptidyl-tRNA hydrolase